MKELLIDYTPFIVSQQEINESILENSGKLIVKGTLQRANSKNQNGRVYPKPILEREIKKYYENCVKIRRALGELDHPNSQVVNLSNTSHNVLSMDWNGDDVIGTIEILDTPAGNILKSLFKAGITLGISSRGLGSVKRLTMEEDVVEVQPDFELIAFDFVSNPSTYGAFLYPMNESYNSESNNSKYFKINSIITDIILQF